MSLSNQNYGQIARLPMSPPGALPSWRALAVGIYVDLYIWLKVGELRLLDVPQ